MDGNSIVSNDVLTQLADAIKGQMANPPSQMTVHQMVTNAKNVANGKVTFNDVVLHTDAPSIGNLGFSFSNTLTSVSLPNVTSIGDGAFFYCTLLTSVSLPNVTSIGDGAFSSCTDLSSLDLSSFTVDEVASSASAWSIPSGCVVTCKDGTYTQE